MKKFLNIYTVSTAALAVTWLLLVHVPQRQTHQTLRGQIEAAQGNLADYERTLDELQAFTRERESLLKVRREMNSQLYTKKDVLSLFARITDQAHQHNLMVKEITPPVEELIDLNRLVPDSTQPYFLTVGVRVEGDYIDFGRFVRSIEEAAYFRGMERCQILSPPDDGITSFQISLKTLLGDVGKRS